MVTDKMLISGLQNHSLQWVTSQRLPPHLLSISVPHFVPISEVDVEIFHRMSENLALLLVLSQWIVKLCRICTLGIIMSVPARFKTFLPVIVEIFQFGPKWWSNQQSRIETPLAMPHAVLK